MLMFDILTNADPGENEHLMTTEVTAWCSTNVHPVITIRPIVADMFGRGRDAIERLGLALAPRLDRRCIRRQPVRYR